MCLYCLIGNSKTMQVGLLGKRAIDRRIVKLDYIPALVTDQQLHRMGMVKMTAEYESVERLHLVGKTLLEQKIERSIDSRRLGMSLGLLQLSQQIIGANGVAVGGQQSEYLAPGRGEADPALFAESFGSL